MSTGFKVRQVASVTLEGRRGADMVMWTEQVPGASGLVETMPISLAMVSRVSKAVELIA